MVIGSDSSSDGGFHVLGIYQLPLDFLSPHFAPASELLADFLLHPAFAPQYIEKQKGIILEEMKRGQEIIASIVAPAEPRIFKG